MSHVLKPHASLAPWVLLCGLAAFCLGGTVASFAQSAGESVQGETLQGDPARGEHIYERCFACHAIDRDRTGPRHAGLFGRVAGSVPGFPYSAAMKQAGLRGLVWNAKTLDAFLENPTGYIPGTRMGYAGIKDAQERADLIAYLQKATQP